jgi:hypothetical protein
MTQTSTNQAVESFIRRFFNEPNRIHQESKPEIGIWVERIRGDDPQPTVLPCFRGGNIVDWYGLAFDDRQLTALGESLTAFVGPTYTTFRGEVARLDSVDPIDTAVRTLTGGRAFKFRGENPKDIWSVLERMRRVWDRRGMRGQATPRPIARVLRDFYMALRARDEHSSQANLLLLRKGGYLDGVNHLYLQVQFLSTFHRWDEIVRHSQLPDLLRLRRPLAVTEAILQAVYNFHLSRFEYLAEPRQAAVAFRNEVLPQYPSLFVTRAGMRSGEAIKTFMLLAVTADPVNLSLREDLLKVGGLDANDKEYIVLLSQIAGPAPHPVVVNDHLVAATDASRVNDYDRAFQLGKAAPPSLPRTRLLCECAFELGTLEARKMAIESVNSLKETERVEFLSSRVNRQLWDSLREFANEERRYDAHVPLPPVDWCSWLDHLDRYDGGEGARELARRGASEWSVEEFAQSDAAEFLAQKLGGNRSQAAERVLRDALPHILSFFERDIEWPNYRFRGIYRSLIDLLIFSTEGGRADLTVFNDLLDGVLVHGVNEADYVELVYYCKDLWKRVAAPTTVDWGIEVAELLISHPCPDFAIRKDYFQAMLDRLMGFSRHVTQDQRLLIKLLADDLGIADTYYSYFEKVVDQLPTITNDPIAAAGGLSVAVYTLVERAARQFQKILEARAQDVSVWLCHDTVASSRLKQLARQADLFVMVTASAKHAATICIEANRPSNLPLLRPSGRGVASMLRVVRDHLIA